MKAIILFTLTTILLSACSTPQMLISNELKTETNTYPVKGVTGWQFNQEVKYGEFSTSKIKRGWTKGYETDFIINFEGAKEKLSFTQKTPNGKEAIVNAVSKFRSADIKLLNSFFSVELGYENTYAGTIIPKMDKAVWDFIIYDVEGGSLENTTKGFAGNQNGDEIEIRGVRKTEGNKAKLFGLEVKGYEFFENGQPIGAVSLIQHGNVWMKAGLDSDTQLILSSMMTALMVRNTME